jgi:cyclic beta-1,2-glucan synthetase
MEGPFDPTRHAARELQQHHVIEPGPPRPLPLLSRSDALASWFEALRRHASDAPPEAAKAAEWLIDNDYILRRAIRDVRKDMPRASTVTCRALPLPEFGGLPRSGSSPGARSTRSTCNPASIR